MTVKKMGLKKTEPVQPETSRVFLEELRRMIEEARQSVAASVNTALTQVYWRVGKRINEEILKGRRAEYGIRNKDTCDSVASIELVAFL